MKSCGNQEKGGKMDSVASDFIGCCYSTSILVVVFFPKFVSCSKTEAPMVFVGVCRRESF